LRSEAQRSGGEKATKKAPHVLVAVLSSQLKTSRGERKMCYLGEASLDIKDVIYQTSCFSKTIVTNKYPLIDIEPISRIALSAASDCAEPVCDQLSVEWQSMENDASHSRIPSIFYHPSSKLRGWNGSKVSTRTNFYYSCNI